MEIINNSCETIEYETAMQEMDNMLQRVIEGNSVGILWLLQHKDVYTIGGSGDISDVLDRSTRAIKTNRGGKVTYHGAGQLVVYPIINLRQDFGSDVHKYVSFLQNVVVNSIGRFGVKCFTKDKMIGVWTKDLHGRDSKISAMGIRVRSGVAYHGISVNIDPDLNKFSGIIPCGISNFGVCSLKQLGVEVSIGEFSEIFIAEFLSLYASFRKR